MAITYHVVVTFNRNGEGDLVPGEPSEMVTANGARLWAQQWAKRHAGAVAFSRTGDPATGEFGDAVVLISVGEVDLDALTT